MNDSLSSLERLGLTTLETEVYAFLARESAATGYRIAQAIGRPISNVYKAIEALESKGAALTSDDDGSRVARAVAPAEWIARQRAEFDRACAALHDMARSSDFAPDERMYRLPDRDAVLSRARAMLASAKSFVVALMTPTFVGELKQDLETAAARGVHVGIKTFDPAELRNGVRVHVDPRGMAAVDTGPGQWISMTNDGAEILNALFDSESGRLHTGIWTAHPLLVWSFYTGLSSDFALAMVRDRLVAERPCREILAELDRMRPFESPTSTGKMHLISRYRRPARRGGGGKRD